MAPVNKVEDMAATNLGALLDAGEGAVVTLVAGETRLAAHKAVLAGRSPVFAAMFRHDTLEASSGEVNIPDVEGPVLRQLLCYLYTLQAPQLPDMAAQLLSAADKYGLSALKDTCEQHLAAQLSVENAVAAGVVALRHSCPSLTAAAVAFIKARTHQVMATRGWADSVRTGPEEVIELTRLVADPPPEASTRSATGGRPIPGMQLHSDHRQMAAPPAPPAPPPDHAVVSRMRRLSEEEKGRILLEAAREGNVQDLQALLMAGVDLGIRNEKGVTALHCAAIEGHLQTVRCLLDAGAEMDTRSNAQNTPLHSAARNGHTAVVRLLVASSADLNARNADGWTPLHRAAIYGHTEVANVLLGAGADRSARDDSGATPRHFARQNNHHELVELLT